MNSTIVHYSLISLLPALFALGLAIKTRRVVESLLLGILSGTMIKDGFENGFFHSILYSIPNLFNAITGYPKNDELCREGMGILKSPGRVEIIIVVLLIGAFITIIQKSGGDRAFGAWLSSKVKTKRGAENSSAIMGCAIFTSAYFSSLATGTVFRPIFDKMKIPRAKLAFILDSTSAPINTLIPISGWVATMALLLADNIKPLDGDGVKGLLFTVPFNFYSISILIFVFLLINGVIKDYGPMKMEEEKVPTYDNNTNKDLSKSTHDDEIKNGKMSDMIIPLGISVILLVILGLWKYTFPNIFTNVDGPSLGGTQILIICFSVGILAAFIKYVSSKLMTGTQFLDEALEGSKSAVIGGIIIILAVTLGDLLRAPAPEGLGAALFLESILGDMLPYALLPVLVFLLSSFMSFSMGTSFGTWAIMMPLVIPLAMPEGNPFLVAAAVLSGGTFGDHCSPISDTTIMSSIGAECDHMKHVNTQLPYALTAAAVSTVLFLICGFLF